MASQCSASLMLIERPLVIMRLVICRGDRRTRGELRRPLADELVELVIRHHAVHDADALGLARAHDVGEQREFLGFVDPNKSRQQPGAAEIDREAALREDLREARALAGHDQIAAERDVEPRAYRHAVHLRDARLRDLVQRQPDPAEVMHLVDLMARVAAASR